MRVGLIQTIAPTLFKNIKRSELTPHKDYNLINKQ